MEDAQKYVDSLPADQKAIFLHERGLTELPDLSRFTQLESLDCSDNALTKLPDLRNTLPYLRRLNCSGNHLTELPLWGDWMKDVNCAYNELTTLPPLNFALVFLQCRNNRLKQLPNLHEPLLILDCRNNNLTSLPALNECLEKLDCTNNHLNKLPPLPYFLKYLSCKSNDLHYLPRLPPTLEVLVCSFNPLYALPESLGTRVRCLHSEWCGLTTIPDFAPCKRLTRLIVNNNPGYETIMEICEINGKITDFLTNTRKVSRFRFLFYSLKMKPKLRAWLWTRVRLPKIQAVFSPERLVQLLGDVDDSNEERFQQVLDLWTQNG
jgi:Leucine-rich repeat (LRR) protein